MDILTHKQVKISRTMIFFAASYLLMASGVFGNMSWNSSMQLLAKVPVSSFSTFHDFSAGSFLDDPQIVSLADSPPLPDPRSKQFVQVFGQNKTIRECMMDWIRPGNMYRTSDSHVLLPIHDSVYGFIKLLLLNTETCKYEYVYDRQFPISYYNFFSSENLKEERFSVVTRGETACQGHNTWCRLYFNPYYQKIELLDFDFPSWPAGCKIELAATYDRNLFTVTFFDESGAYRVRLYDLSANRTSPLYRELFTIPDFIQRITWHHVESSGLSFCWRSIRGDGLHNPVNCSKFREDGTLLFNSAIPYPNAMTLHKVAAVPDGLILISSKNGDSSILQVALITHGIKSMNCQNCSDIQHNLEPLGNELIQIKHRQYIKNYENCYGEDFKVELKESDGSLEVSHLCVAKNYFSVSAFSVDWNGTA